MANQLGILHGSFPASLQSISYAVFRWLPGRSRTFSYSLAPRKPLPGMPLHLFIARASGRQGYRGAESGMTQLPLQEELRGLAAQLAADPDDVTERGTDWAGVPRRAA